MNNTFMKEKPVLPLLASMAMPMVLSMLVNSLYNIVDSFFVAKIRCRTLSMRSQSVSESESMCRFLISLEQRTLRMRILRRHMGCCLIFYTEWS